VKPRGRDYAWATFAVVFGGLSAFGWLVRAFETITGNVPVAFGIAGLTIGGLIAFWITVGAWRRTIWGKPQADPSTRT
jgi:hypothetical protein